MKISGFTMVKNAGILMYPFRQSVLSMLPIVDELVIALGNCDAHDTTLAMIEEINNPKIKVINTVWDVKEYPKGTILAQQTDVAKSHCTGDWLIYLQADEVLHENDYYIITEACNKYYEHPEVEGFLFKYIHFWGDFNHAFTGNHAWYRNEIRVVRNRPDIHSWRDAQSFRAIEDFSKEKYLEKKGTRKLKVVHLDAHIYHYGWVRPPKIMGKKQTHFRSCYKDDNIPEEEMTVISEIDFGPMGTVPFFKGSHPRVMNSLIESFDWGNQLNYSKRRKKDASIPKHYKLKNRLLSYVENKISPRGIFTFKNYRLLRPKRLLK